MRCYLWNKCKKEHERANPKFVEKLYFVGKLFKAPICGHCLIRLQQLTQPTPTDGSVAEMEAFRAQHPEYTKLLDELGKDKVRFELNLRENVVEADPNDYKEITTGVPVEFGEPGEKVGNPPELPRKPNVVVY